MQIRPWNSRTGVPDSHLNHAVGHSGGHGKHADSLHRLDGIHDHVGKGLSKLLRPRIDSGNRTIVRPNLQAGAFPGQLREFESLAQLGIEIDLHGASFDPCAGKAGEVLNDGGHPLAVLDDVFRVDLHLVEIGLILDRLP